MWIGHCTNGVSCESTAEIVSRILISCVGVSVGPRGAKATARRD